ncbi:MAG: Ni/Fe hydrogenase subunit alpha [Candidatus Omnitrophica bacterium]|nr:Ni/Fe hydrogenase subunit alpha [Candidatus Omnitrophota bacterium]
MTRKIEIEPITRLEGHGKIAIFLDDTGKVENAYFQVPELRGFEEFCKGRPVEELPRITPRICGVCPWAHHMASTKTVDAVYNVKPTSAAKKIRELAYNAFFFADHLLHFYYLAAADFVVGPTAPPGERNILGAIAKLGIEKGKEVIKHRIYGEDILRIIGGKPQHPVCGLPGGVSKPLTKEERNEIEEKLKSCVEFAKFTLKLFDDLVLKNKQYLDLILSKDVYYHETNYMGMVDENDKVNFYDGKLKVIDPSGKELYKFDGRDYNEYLSEHMEEWSYIKFLYLKKIGWKGFVDGAESGVYRVAPLARLNVASGMNTPEAQAAYEQMFATIPKPIHHTQVFHWARLVEMLNAAERALELIRDPEITSPDVHNVPTETPHEGIGVVEAPRGTLFHHYVTDKNGIIERANLLVATLNNSAPICMSIKKAAEALIKGPEVDEGVLNMIEMAFRPYDPCFGCATHSLPGEMPMQVTIFDSQGKPIRELRRD